MYYSIGEQPMTDHDHDHSASEDATEDASTTSSGTITGTVTDADGTPIERARIYISFSDSDNVLQRTTTGSNGNYSVSENDETYDVRAEKVGFETEVKTVTVSGNTVTADFSLDSAAYKIRGELTDRYGRGILGRNDADSGTPAGLKGVVPSAPDGTGVIGRNRVASGFGYGVRGIKGKQPLRNVIGLGGAGVKGVGADQGADGVFGRTTTSETTNFVSGLGSDIAGVRGVASNFNGNARGVVGVAEGIGGAAGVVGKATGFTGVTYGVYGRTRSSEGYGVYCIGQLGVVRDVAYDGNPRRHVATIENTSGDNNGDILGLKTQVFEPDENMNFISFLHSNGQVGQVDGNGSGGVNYKSASNDLAEYFPQAEPDRTFDAGDVVGLRAGEAVADPTDADVALVVSDAPMMTGNAPLNEDGDGTVCLALLGQVPVRAGAPVEADDRLAATPDGRAVPADEAVEDAPAVGRALSTARAAGDRVETLVTASAASDVAADPRVEALAAANDRKDERLDAHRERIDRLERENEELRERLASLETQVATEAAPADD